MRRSIKGLLLCITIGLVGSLIGLSPYGISFERSVDLDWLFTARGTIKSPSETVVVAIDGLTGEKLGIPDLPRDWPRSIHGKLVDSLVERGASVIVFDLDFHKPRTSKDELAFAHAIERSERVVLYQHLVGKGQSLEQETGKRQGNLWVEKLFSPVPALSDAAAGLAPFPLPRSETSVHEFWVFKSSGQELATMPAVGLQIHALKIFEQFSRLLDNSGLSGFMKIPESASDISGAAKLREFMIAVRGAILKNPELGRNLALELKRPWLDGETVETRLLLESLVSMYRGNDKRLLNFYGPPGTIETIPYHLLIQGEYSDTNKNDLNLAGKVVFVGYSDFYDPNQPDQFHTVFTREPGFHLSGVEIAATAFGNLLHDTSLRFPNTLVMLGILFGFGFLVSALVYFTPAIFGVPAATLLSAGYVFYAYVQFNDSHLWLPLAIPILVQLPLALFIGISSQYLGQRKKVRHISEAISVYVPEEISRAMVSKDLKPEDVNRTSFSTCLATDMEGFTAISEKMKAGELAAFLNDYFDTLAQPMINNNVTVTDFRADAIMCAWTGEKLDIDLRRRPILAALQAVDAIEEFRERHRSFKANLRIGMETGEVYVGHAGGGRHMGYRVVGDCVNTASRIEGLNKLIGTRLLAASSVVEGIDDFLLRPLGEYVFLGKSESVRVIEIIDFLSSSSERQRELCERFAHAIDIFSNKSWKLAAESFGAILTTFEDDGPSRFYLSQCQQRLKEPVNTADPCVIHLNAK